jgi:hypothetical protein
MKDEQIKHMVDRFLSWRLPQNFNPDNGISYTRPNYLPSVDATPSGTNLFDATQAETMVRHMIDGLPAVSSAAAEDVDKDSWEWAIVEVFGHRKHAGRTREEERFGAKLLRIDIPNKGAPAEHGWTTIYYGGASIFSFALATEETVLKANKPYDAAARLTYYRDSHDDFGNDPEDDPASDLSGEEKEPAS